MKNIAIVRRAAITCAALLALVPVGDVARAVPPSSPGIPPGLATALERDLRMGPAEYLRRANDAQRLGTFAAQARRHYPGVFAGVWLDKDGSPIVALTEGPQKEAARKAAEAARFIVKDVSRSENALRGTKKTVQDWVASQPPAIASLVHAITIDIAQNIVAVRVDPIAGGIPLPPFLGPIRVVSGGRATTGERIGGRHETAAVPGPALIGGEPYVTPVGEHRYSLCSFGFNGTNGTNDVNITAGHCNPNIAAAGTGNSGTVSVWYGSHLGEAVGTYAKSVLGHRDYSIIQINDALRGRFENNLVGTVPGQAPIAIDGVAIPVVGAPACKSGERSGFNCGYVDATDESVTAYAEGTERTMDNQVALTICALPGDSGGAVTSGTKALAITSVSSVAEFPTCDLPNAIGSMVSDFTQLWAQPVATVLAENPGLQVRTH